MTNQHSKARERKGKDTKNSTRTRSGNGWHDWRDDWSKAAKQRGKFSSQPAHLLISLNFKKKKTYKLFSVFDDNNNRFGAGGGTRSVISRVS
jgi:hypothetical protein